MVTRSRQSGLTLVELLIGLAIGLLLLLGVAALFTQNKQSYRQNDDLARLQEEARFAVEELSRDLSMAGFVAELVDPTIFDVGVNATDEGTFVGALGTAVNCGPAGLGSNWFYDFSLGLAESAILHGDNVGVAPGPAPDALFSCVSAGDFQPGTDMIGIKRTSGVPSGRLDTVAGINAPAPNGRVYVRENGSKGVLYQSAAFPPASGSARAVPEPYRDWEYSPRIYFVRNYGVTPGDGIPTLCRIRLVNDGTGGRPPAHEEECLAQGVENLQIEYGLDTNDDGAANVYVTNPGPLDIARTVAVRFYLLMRTANLDVGYRDDRTYSLSNSPDYTPADRFHRRVYSATAVVRNVNSVRQLGF